MRLRSRKGIWGKLDQPRLGRGISYRGELGSKETRGAKAHALTASGSGMIIRKGKSQTAGFEKRGGYEMLLFEPGTKWHYSDGGPNWLAECLTLQYGRDLHEVMFDRVFSPIGIGSDDLDWRKNQYRAHTSISL